MTLPFEGALAYRHRSFWEAADAGLLLWRENFVYFLPFFAVPFWICAFALRLIPEESRYLSWLLLWFARPLFDRPVLHVISVRYFEEGAGAGRLLRKLLPSLWRGLAGDLLWRRFSPFRFVMMPLRVLENPRRRRLGERRRSLNKGGLGLGALLTVWGSILEVVLFGGEVLFLFIMYFLLKDDLFAAFDFSTLNWELWIFVLWCLNFMLIESLCVCMGFSVYLNSRVEVEGWDLEILLRGLCEKIKRKGRLLAPVLLCFLFFAAGSITIFADDRPAPLSSANVPHEVLENILVSPEFGGEKESWGIKLKKAPLPQKQGPGFLPAPSAPWINKILQSAAFLLRMLVALLIAAAIAFLIWYLRKFLPQRKLQFRKNTSSTRALTAQAVESPELLLQRAAYFFEQGDLRLAWGFCAAAALRSWPEYRGISFPPDATEYDCVSLIKAAVCPTNNGNAANAGEAESLAALVGHWTNFAYGGRLPPPGSFEAAMDYCKALGAQNE